MITKYALACMVGFALSLSVQVFAFAQISDTYTTENTNRRKLPEGAIRDVAKQITVRVYAIDSQSWKDTYLDTIPISGSGVIVAKKEVNKSLYLYLILTNNHVAKESDKFYVETPDGLSHIASVFSKTPFKTDKLDLGLLGFYSPYSYEVTPIGKSKDLKSDSNVFIAGFPCELANKKMDCPAQFTFSQGTAYLIDKPLKDGYQLAFTNETKEGTSGGAILDDQGKLVGINGKGKIGEKKIAFDSPQYQYQDGSEMPSLFRERPPFALGIPIEYYSSLSEKELLATFLRQEKPQNFDTLFFPKKKLAVQNEPTPIVNNNPSQNSEDFVQEWFRQILKYSGIVSLLLIMLLALLIILLVILDKQKPRNRKRNPIIVARLHLKNNSDEIKICYNCDKNSNLFQSVSLLNKRQLFLNTNHLYYPIHFPIFIPTSYSVIEIHPNFLNYNKRLVPELICSTSNKDYQIEKIEDSKSDVFQLVKYGHNEEVKIRFKHEDEVNLLAQDRQDW